MYFLIYRFFHVWLIFNATLDFDRSLVMQGQTSDRNMHSIIEFSFLRITKNQERFLSTTNHIFQQYTQSKMPRKCPPHHHLFYSQFYHLLFHRSSSWLPCLCERNDNQGWNESRFFPLSIRPPFLIFLLHHTNQSISNDEKGTEIS